MVGEAGELARAEALPRLVVMSAEVVVRLENQPVGLIAPVKLLAARTPLAVYFPG